ncbi:hypothetical protein BV22DRAFT_998736 [Leucogyrophana mollusca]|uniref:Uncharacterized protein n=1 Tax=Leucogyrophana mollusca TaxID=85980 RepID=A0ACB8C1B4_9AGAM|nr:hypothetical protein BV22DRAFT_998736 [Leucogyrophana mollusca]
MSNILLRLPVESVHAILALLPFDALQKLASLSKIHRGCVVAYLNHRKSTLLAQFFNYPTAFIELLRLTSSVVSGSVALQMLLPAVSVRWSSSNIDIYVPRSQVIIVMAYLAQQNYQTVCVGGDRPVRSQSSVHTVVAMINGSKTIEIVVSITECAVRPVFQIHSTIVMNYITHNGFFSAYPKLTGQYRALFNVMSMRDARLVLGNMQALVKFQRRGFDVQSVATAWDEEDGIPHECGNNVNCPHLLRSSDDAGCLWMTLDMADNVPDEFHCADEPVVLWCMGGEGCDGAERLDSGSFLTVL